MAHTSTQVPRNKRNLRLFSEEEMEWFEVEGMKPC